MSTLFDITERIPEASVDAAMNDPHLTVNVLIRESGRSTDVAPDRYVLKPTCRFEVQEETWYMGYVDVNPQSGFLANFGSRTKPRLYLGIGYDEIQQTQKLLLRELAPEELGWTR